MVAKQARTRRKTEGGPAVANAIATVSGPGGHPLFGTSAD